MPKPLEFVSLNSKDGLHAESTSSTMISSDSERSPI